MTPQVLTILGSTGSIGESTLDVVSRHPEKFRVFALAGHKQVEKLAAQCRTFRPEYAVVADAEHAARLEALLKRDGTATQVLHGAQALVDVASADEVSGVMCAIVGAAGLPSALAAAQKGKTIYLANKETLVVSGALFMETARANGAAVLPIDSEHNAIFQVLPRDYTGRLNEHGIRSIILTASGGPFLTADLGTFDSITPAQAVKHPNWSMGRKISVDSATMMNKGLELIEAHWLFNCPPDKLEVVIHPQSVIHSMVRYRDGSVLAQLGNPDMRTPIAYCLGLPERIESGGGGSDVEFLEGAAQADGEVLGVAARAGARGEAGHGDGVDVRAGPTQAVHGAGGHDEGVGGVQAAADADDDLGVADGPQALDEGGHLDVVGLGAVRGESGRGVKPVCMRDATRGGLSAVLNEWAKFSGLDILVREEDIRVSDEVTGVCELFGFEPYELANEGTFVLAVDEKDEARALEILRKFDANAALIGEILGAANGRVILQNAYGSKRFLEAPKGELLPRIC